VRGRPSLTQSASVALTLLALACADGQAPAPAESCSSEEPVFHINAVLSPAIQTVATVTWSVDEPIESATIDFGRTPDELSERAPVEVGIKPFHTVLLGMRPASNYYFRITTEGPCGTRQSVTTAVTTGLLPSGLPPGSVADSNADKLFAKGGFTVNCTGLATHRGVAQELDDGTPTWAMIFDRGGEVVWAHELSGTPVAGCTRARLSLDGKYLWIGNLNDQGGKGALRRVSLDGVGVRDYPTPARHHDFAILPNDHLVYAEQKNAAGDADAGAGPDVLRELDPLTGKVKTLYDETTDFASDIAASSGAHTNQVNYVPDLGALSFSMLGTKQIGLVGYPKGDLQAVFGGASTSFTGLAFQGQHGHDVRDGHAWVFVNGEKTGATDVLGFFYDLPTHVSRSFLDYSCARDSVAFGDVKELPNGNLFVTYSEPGIFQELTASGELLREQRVNAVLGYSEHRASLYGAPPPYDRE